MDGKETFDNSEMYHIRLIGKNTKSKSYLIHTKDFLIKKIRTSNTYRGESYVEEQILGNYKNADGITFAMKKEITSDIGSSTIIYNKISLNEKRSNTLFEL